MSLRPFLTPLHYVSGVKLQLWSSWRCWQVQIRKVMTEEIELDYLIREIWSRPSIALNLHWFIQWNKWNNNSILIPGVMCKSSLIYLPIGPDPHPSLALSLSLHPFSEGNGRLNILTTYTLIELGFESCCRPQFVSRCREQVARCERLIFHSVQTSFIWLSGDLVKHECFCIPSD